MDDSERISRQRGLRRAVLAGDEDAWRVLYGEHYAAMVRYFRGRVPSDVADELVQEVWMHAVRRIDSFDPARASFEAWLYGIAENVLRNYYRRRRPAQLTDETALEDASRPPSDADTSEEVSLALVELPADYQRVLNEKYDADRSVDEIAQRWRRSPKAIESLLSRARAAFRAAYLRITGDEPP